MELRYGGPQPSALGRCEMIRLCGISENRKTVTKFLAPQGPNMANRRKFGFREMPHPRTYRQARPQARSGLSLKKVKKLFKKIIKKCKKYASDDSSDIHGTTRFCTSTESLFYKIQWRRHMYGGGDSDSPPLGPLLLPKGSSYRRGGAVAAACSSCQKKTCLYFLQCRKQFIKHEPGFRLRAHR